MLPPTLTELRELYETTAQKHLSICVVRGDELVHTTLIFST